MLVKKDLRKQKTFRQWDETTWFDGCFEFFIYFGPNRSTLHHHNEVDGSSWLIKDLKNLEDLKKVYEAITDTVFK